METKYSAELKKTETLWYSIDSKYHLTKASANKAIANFQKKNTSAVCRTETLKRVNANTVYFAQYKTEVPKKPSQINSPFYVLIDDDTLILAEPTNYLKIAGAYVFESMPDQSFYCHSNMAVDFYYAIEEYGYQGHNVYPIINQIRAEVSKKEAAEYAKRMLGSNIMQCFADEKKEEEKLINEFYFSK